MKNIFLAYVCVVFCVLASGAFLMNVSYRVQHLEREIKQHEIQIAKEEEAIKVLQAEWAYLNNPVRLEAMVTRGLALSSPDPRNFFSASDDVSYYHATNKDGVPLPPDAPSRASEGDVLLHDIVYTLDTERGAQ